MTAKVVAVVNPVTIAKAKVQHAKRWGVLEWRAEACI